jgi:hypothetical protein
MLSVVFGSVLNVTNRISRSKYRFQSGLEAWGSPPLRQSIDSVTAWFVKLES